MGANLNSCAASKAASECTTENSNPDRCSRSSCALPSLVSAWPGRLVLLERLGAVCGVAAGGPCVHTPARQARAGGGERWAKRAHCTIVC